MIGVGGEMTDGEAVSVPPERIDWYDDVGKDVVGVRESRERLDPAVWRDGRWVWVIRR